MLQIFSNRELALLIWIVLGIIVLTFLKSVRRAIINVFKTFFQKSILLIFSIAVLYCAAIVGVLSLCGFWDTTMIKDTIFWFIGSGLIVLFNVNKALRQEQFFLTVFRDNIKLVLIIEFIANVHVFSFGIELIILPLITFFAMMQAYSEIKIEYKQVDKLMSVILTLIGLLFIFLSVKDIFGNVEGFVSYTTLKFFFLPIILSITFLPCVFLIAVIMEYELIFVRLSMFLKNRKDLAFAKRRIVLNGLISLKKLKLLSNNINELYNGSSREDIRRIIS